MVGFKFREGLFEFFRTIGGNLRDFIKKFIVLSEKKTSPSQVLHLKQLGKLSFFKQVPVEQSGQTKDEITVFD